MRSTDRVRLPRALLLVPFLAWLALAPAATAQTAEDHAWAATGPLAPPVAAEDRIYVSQAGGQEQARSFVRVPDRTVRELRGAEVTLVEGSGGFASDNAELRACAMTGPLAGSGRVEDPPAADCDRAVPLLRDADGRWLVPLGPLADALDGPGDGWFAVTPAEEAEAPAFTVAFDPSKTQIRLPPTEHGEGDEPATVPTPPPSTDGEDAAPPPSQVPSVLLPPGPLLSDPDADLPPSARADTAPPPAAPVPRLVRDDPARPRAAADPPAAVLLLVAAGAALALWARGRWLPPVLAPGAAVPQRSLASWGIAATLALLVLLMSEAAVYKLGFIGIVFIAAIGLHILVNWAGELSLAHASFVGLPAFTVAQLTHHTG